MANYTRVKLSGIDTYKGMASLYLRGKRLVIRLPDTVELGRNKYWSTGLPATNQGINKGMQLLSLINNDIVFEQFDPSLEKYKPAHKRETYLKEVERLVGSETPLIELWGMYCDFKAINHKESYVDYLRVTIGDRIRDTKVENIHDSDAVLKALVKNTTEKTTKRVLEKISALFKWCLDKKIIAEVPNPYPQVVKVFCMEMGQSEPPEARPLSRKEEAELFTKMAAKYHGIINFCLLTGCRPSEAIGIEWQDIHLEEDYLTIGRSIRVKGKKVYKSSSSKTGRRRKFPINDQLKEHLSQQDTTYDLVHPNPDSSGAPFTYDSYFHAWKKAMPKDTTPYSCRDTFISKQIELGIPPAVVAKWVDNSVILIEQRYLKVGEYLKPI